MEMRNQRAAVWSGALETACSTHMTTADMISSNMSHFSADIRAAVQTKQIAIKNLSKNTSPPKKGNHISNLYGNKKKKKDLVFIKEWRIILVNKWEHEPFIMGQ